MIRIGEWVNVSGADSPS